MPGIRRPPSIARATKKKALVLDAGGRLRTALALSRPLPAHWLALEGKAREVLPEHIDRTLPDLVVMGMDRDYTLGKILLGGLAHLLLSHLRSDSLLGPR